MRFNLHESRDNPDIIQVGSLLRSTASSSISPWWVVIGWSNNTLYCIGLTTLGNAWCTGQLDVTDLNKDFVLDGVFNSVKSHVFD